MFKALILPPPLRVRVGPWRCVLVHLGVVPARVWVMAGFSPKRAQLRCGRPRPVLPWESAQPWRAVPSSRGQRRARTD